MKKRTLLFSLACAVALCFSPFLNAQDIESGLVVYFPMDGDGVSGLDAAVEATLEGDVVATTGFNEDENGALLYDGEGDRVSIDDTELVGLPVEDTERTVACWTLIKSGTGNLKWVSYGTPSSDPKGAHVHFAYRPNEGEVGDFTGRIRVGHWYADYDWDGIDLKDSTWHHVAYTYDGDVFALYLDGSLVSELDVNPDNAPVFTVLNGVFSMGARNVPELNDAIEGAIDEVRIYDRVLTSDDILALSEYDPSAVEAVDNLSAPTFNVMPNPASDVLNLTGLQVGSKVSLLNIVGQQVMSGTAIYDDFSFNVSGLNAGTYIIKVDNVSQKVLIK